MEKEKRENMPRTAPGRKSITAIFTDEEYEQIKILAAKKNVSMSNVIRDFVCDGLNGQLTESNLDFIVPIIRDQIKSVLEPQMERLISLTAKSCIQSGTATYLAADTIYKFVPPEQREEVETVYEEARKKALVYMRSKADKKES